MLLRHADYSETFGRFAWRIPARFNIGVACCDRHADGSGRPALIYEDEASVASMSFDALKRRSNQFANMLRGHGIGQGDRVGILLPQRPETAIAHIAVYKMAAIALPLFIQFGSDALEHRLRHSGAAALITDLENLPKIAAIRDLLPELRRVFVVGADAGEPGHLGLEIEMAKSSDAFSPVDTGADDPALIIYTSGTTGKPKGALHAHRVLLGHLPGVQLPQEFFPQTGDVFWTPADWAWIGGCSTCCCPAFILAFRCWPRVPENSIPKPLLT